MTSNQQGEIKSYRKSQRKRTQEDLMKGSRERNEKI